MCKLVNPKPLTTGIIIGVRGECMGLQEGLMAAEVVQYSKQKQYAELALASADTLSGPYVGCLSVTVLLSLLLLLLHVMIGHSNQKVP